MVHLNRIYTKSGDQGKTTLGDGSRVSKTHDRVIAYGMVDELNAAVGVAATTVPAEIKQQLSQIQNELFDLGAVLCVPEQEAPRQKPRQEPQAPRLGISPDQIIRLESWIDLANHNLKPLDSFILPGGKPAAAHLHYARTVCRRAEIAVLKLAESEKINEQIAIYLNRLSDFLFVLARVCNNGGSDDVLWIPSKGHSQQTG